MDDREMTALEKKQAQHIQKLEAEAVEASKSIRGWRDGDDGWYAKSLHIAALEAENAGLRDQIGTMKEDGMLIYLSRERTIEEKEKYLIAWDTLRTWLSFNYLEIMEEFDESHPEEEE